MAFLRDDLPGHETTWSENIDAASQVLTDNETVDEQVFVNGKWPVSKLEELGGMEQTGTTALDPSSGFPSPEVQPQENSPEPELPGLQQGTDTSVDTSFESSDVVPTVEGDDHEEHRNFA